MLCRAVAGGAVLITTPVDSPRNLLYCENGTSPQFREWELYSSVTVRDTRIVNNSVMCPGACSGGGIAMSAGGTLVLTNATIAGNVASSFGGWIAAWRYVVWSVQLLSGRQQLIYWWQSGIASGRSGV